MTVESAMSKNESESLSRQHRDGIVRAGCRPTVQPKETNRARRAAQHQQAPDARRAEREVGHLFVPHVRGANAGCDGHADKDDLQRVELGVEAGLQQPRRHGHLCRSASVGTWVLW